MGLRTRLSRERGQSLVVVALMLVVLIGALGLVVDVGNLYAQRRFMQNAADAAALAGARELALDEPVSTVQTAIDTFAITANGGQAVESQVLTETVAVTVTEVVPSYFMGVMGIETNTVAGVAEAGYCPVGNPPGVMPFGVDEKSLKFDCQTMIWDNYDGDPTKDKDYPDPSWIAANNLVMSPHRGWINLDGVSGDARELKDWVTPAGYPGVIDISGGGRWYPGSTGTKASALGILSDWVNPSAIDYYARDVYIPVYTQYEDASTNSDLGGAEANYFITGFARMHLIEVRKTTDFKFILGELIYNVDPDDDLVCGTADYGSRILQLER